MIATAMSRRTFLKVTTVAGTGLAVGCVFDNGPALTTSAGEGGQLGLWVRISPDNRITLVVPASEMGQGAHTGQAMLLAEQLEAGWDTIEVVTAPVGSAYGNKKIMYQQITGGSSSVTAWWEELSEVGAATRELLVEAAAQQWQVSDSECTARAGRVYHEATARSLSYGQLAGAAAKLSPPWRPKMKPREDYRLIGKSIPRLDIPAKVNGSAVFGIDVRRPGMRFAAVSQSPVFGGEVTSYDESSALAIKGVESVVAVPNGVAVVADSTWHAHKGLEALAPQFAGGVTRGLDSAKVDAMLRSKLDEIGKVEIEGDRTLDVEYQVPFLMHATLEPMNCTAHVTENSCDVWVPAQNQDRCESAAADASGLSSDQVNIHTTLCGGGFGRRLESDFVTQAVTISRAVTKPVQVIWSREEDTQHGFYRPASMSRFHHKTCHFPTKHGGLADGGKTHTRSPYVYTENSATIDFAEYRAGESTCQSDGNLPLASSLDAKAAKLGSCAGQLAITKRACGCFVVDATGSGGALRIRHLPLLSGGFYK